MPLFGPPDVAKLQARRDIAGLINALGYGKDPSVRRSAADILGQMGGPAIGSLVIALRHQDANVRLGAATALGEIGSAQALDALEVALTDHNVAVCVATVVALGKIGDPTSVASLLFVAEGLAEAQVRQAVADALGRMGASALEPLVSTLQKGAPRMREAAVRALGQAGASGAVESLIAALRDPDEQVRRFAARSLGEIGDAGAVDRLVSALEEDESLYVAEAAAVALGKIGSSSIKGLAALLRNPRARDSVRRSAAEALGGIRDPAAVQPLIGALDDRDQDVRLAAIDGLGVLGDMRALKPLLAALRDRNWADTRKAAASAIGRIGSAGAIRPLVAALSDEKWAVRKAAAIGLVAIYRSGKVGSEDRALLLEHRSAIVEAHVDGWHGSFGNFHTDTGIGVNFPV